MHLDTDKDREQNKLKNKNKKQGFHWTFKTPYMRILGTSAEGPCLILCKLTRWEGEHCSIGQSNIYRVALKLSFCHLNNCFANFGCRLDMNGKECWCSPNVQMSSSLMIEEMSNKVFERRRFTFCGTHSMLIRYCFQDAIWNCYVKALFCSVEMKSSMPIDS